MHLVRLAVLGTSLLALRSAAAQPGASAPPAPAASAAPAPPATAPPASQSVLPGVLPMSAGTTFDGRLDYTRFGDAQLGIPTLVALSLHGQYLARSGLGGYLSLPIAYASGGGDSATALGNIELGALFAFRGASVDAYVRGGLATHETSGADDSFVVPIANLVPRPSDAFATGLGASWLRTGGGVRLTSDAVVLGGSGGIDFALGSEGEQANLLHLTFSIGIAQPRFGLAAGVTLIQVLDSDDGGGDDGFFGFQLLGDVPIGGKVRLYGAMGFNFEEDEDAISFGLGVRAGL